MYFRTKKTPSGTVLQLVESFRLTDGSPRQRIVASLGNPNIEAEHWAQVAKAVEKRLYGREEMFDWDYPDIVRRHIDRIVRQVDMQGRWRRRPEQTDGAGRNCGPSAERQDATIDGVFLEKIEHEHSAALGALLVGRHAWRELDFDGCLGELGFSRAQRQAAAATILNRLVDPVSENALGQWVKASAMPELFGEELLRAPRDRFYRASDKLLEHKEAIEAHVRQRQQKVLSLQRTLFLYDLTNTYFEGKAHLNPKAKRGRSKHKRHDCPQIVIGMVFDEHGFELGHEIFEGNRHDSPTLPQMLERMQQAIAERNELFHQAKPVVVLDGGLASKRNLKALRRMGFGYFVNESRNGRKAYAEHFKSDEGFTPLARKDGQSTVEVKMIPDPQAEPEDAAPDTLVLCRSQGREHKERAIRSTADTRLLEGLEALEKRVAKGKLKDPVKIERAIGALLARHSRVARFYEVTVEKLPEPNECGACRQLRWTSKKDHAEEDEQLLGCYAIRTDQDNVDAQTIWQTYMTLTRAEDGFRALKSDLGLRPNRHHVERRVDGHVFICVLAYHLLQYIRYRLHEKGDTRCWPTIKRLLATHCYATVVAPTKDHGLLRIRKAGRPEFAQRAVYDALDVEWRNLPVIRERVPV
ncbi:MAG: IS1634 family transposase [Alphaproteobacteria bacterium]